MLGIGTDEVESIDLMEVMGEAWELLTEYPLRLTTPLLLSGIGGSVVFASLRYLRQGAGKGLATFALGLLLFMGSYLAVAVATRILFTLMGDFQPSERSALRDVLALPDLVPLLRLLVWHVVKMMPLGVLSALLSYLVLSMAGRVVEHKALTGTGKGLLSLSCIQVALLSWTLLMSRYSLAIPFMVQGEKNARTAILRSMEAVRRMGWKVESLSAIEYCAVVLLPSLALRWAGHAPSTAHPTPLLLQAGLDIFRAAGTTLFVVALGLLVRGRRLEQATRS